MAHQSEKPVLLFLNPPAPVTVIRDYYCSKTSRSNYLFPPIDFVIQSGVHYSYYNLNFIDAVRDRLSENETIGAIERLNPNIIFFIAGAVNHPSEWTYYGTLNGDFNITHLPGTGHTEGRWIINNLRFKESR